MIGPFVPNLAIIPASSRTGKQILSMLLPKTLSMKVGVEEKKGLPPPLDGVIRIYKI